MPSDMLKPTELQANQPILMLLETKPANHSPLSLKTPDILMSQEVQLQLYKPLLPEPPLRSPLMPTTGLSTDLVFSLTAELA